MAENAGVGRLEEVGRKNGAVLRAFGRGGNGVVASRRTGQPIRARARRDGTGSSERDAAAAALTLPEIGAGVPQELVLDEYVQQATLAMALDEAGLLDPVALRRERKGLGKACCTTLTRAIEGLFDTVQQQRLRVEVSISLNYQSAQAHGRPTVVLSMRWGAIDDIEVFVKEAITRMERVEAGLGAQVLATLERVSWLSLPVFTCIGQVGAAEYAWWGGCSSPEENADTCEMDDDERRDYLAAVPSRAAVEAVTPPLVREYPKRTKSAADWRRLARHCRDGYVREVARAMADLIGEDGLLERERYACFHGEQQEGDFVGWGAALRWSEGDLVQELMGQMREDSFNSGTGYDVCGAMDTQLDAQAVKELMRELTVAAERVAGVERLIALLQAPCLRETTDKRGGR